VAFGLTTIRDRIAKGKANTFRYPINSGGSASGSGYASWNDWLVNRLLPSTDFDYVTEAGELWKNAVVSSCLRFLLSTFPEPSLIVKRMVPDPDSETPGGMTEEDVDDHPLLELLSYPNDDDDDSTALAQAFCIDYNLFGNAYTLMLRNGAGRVTGLQPISYNQMQPVADKTGQKRVAWYAYLIDGQAIPYATEDIIHDKFGRDPANIRKGFQPLIGACRDICTENELSTLAASVARNMGIVPYLVSPAATDIDAVIPKDQKEQLEEKFASRTRDKRGTTMVMQRAFKVDRIGLSPDELMADKSRAVAVSRICGALGLDPMVVSLPSDSKTYSNYAESLTAAYHHNIVPVGDAYCTKRTRVFRKEPGYLQPNERLAWDYSKVAALQENEDAKFKRWGDLYKVGGCTRLQLKQALGLPYEESRDDVYIQEITPVGGGASDLEDAEKDPAAVAKMIRGMIAHSVI
jgi:phage portal protein BeeE